MGACHGRGRVSAPSISGWRDDFARSIATQAERWGVAIDVDWCGLTDRSHTVRLAKPGLQSANGSCRLIRSADHWVAVNMPRESDWDLVPAWTGATSEPGNWQVIEHHIAKNPSGALVEEAGLFGLALSILGETPAMQEPTISRRLGVARPRPASRRSVVDMSSLWAGPLCGALLAAAGASVVKVESVARPDSTGRSAPLLDRLLNGAKDRIQIDFADADAMSQLGHSIAGADILVTSARPRALAALGLTPERLFARNSSLIWVAITAHGWSGEGRDRIGFGDDAAVAGGLVDRVMGEPRFLGDAAADPLTGMAAAQAALSASAEGGGIFIDAALARVAAWCVAQRSPA